MRVSDEDGHRSVLRRQQSVCISYTDDLNQLQDQPESEFTLKLVAHGSLVVCVYFYLLVVL